MTVRAPAEFLKEDAAAAAPMDGCGEVGGPTPRLPDAVRSAASPTSQPLLRPDVMARSAATPTPRSPAAPSSTPSSPAPGASILEPRRPPPPTDGWNAASSVSKRDSPLCQQDDNFHSDKEARYLGPALPEDIWCRIHSLLTMQDAARVACVSRSFLASWRCHPKLTFTNETMCLKENLMTTGSKAVIRDYNNNIDRVLMNRSGAAVTELRLDYHVADRAESYHRLDSWLQIAVTPRTEYLNLRVCSKDQMFDFPCTLLSDRCGGSIQNLLLVNCALRPTFELGLKSLKMLHLQYVGITGEELGCLLSSLIALEQLRIKYCDDIIRLEIPCLLQRLSFLEVSGCLSLEVIENKAPNLSTFWFEGQQVQVSLGESKVKDVQLMQSFAISYAIDNLPSYAPNIETLTIYSSREIGYEPMASSKFLHLKFLTILLCSRSDSDYDCLSLVSLFDASPSLEMFCLYVIDQSTFDWFEGDASSLRRMPQHRHGNLKSVKIVGFFPQKSMVELTCHILEMATALTSLTVDVVPANYRCSGNELSRKCHPLNTSAIVDAYRSVSAVTKYIEGKVPSTVKFDAPKPCKRCHPLRNSGVESL